MSKVAMRAKLTIVEVTSTVYGDKVKYNAVYSDNKEDNTYAAATPSASAEFNVSNKELVGKFKPGQQFYVDFTPVE